ncbi:MAG: neutral/alkaline ceramidase [Methanosarcinaceae archaeon]|nr:neutral/alkaline ceramidase [Methanosarcinaceae archaeon]
MGYLIGIGKSDITGPCIQVGFMGMSNLGQQGEGLHTRLFSRAFILVDAQRTRVAVVIVDLGMCSQAVKLEVVRRLGADPEFQESGHPLYTDENLMISATHTHSGPGGYSHYLAYNASITGFSHQNFECIVNGIIESLREAHNSIKPGRVLMARGPVPDCGGNRSLNAHMRNPDPGPDHVDRDMILLKFTTIDGGPRGMINWFPAHPTTMGEKNRLVSGDHKGAASILFEKAYGGIIGAFANSNCGDQSSNMKFGFRPDGVHDIAHCLEIGRIQYEAASQLFEAASTEIDGPISHRLTYTDMSCHMLTNPDRRTWPGAFGYGMLNGSQEDSEGFKVKKWGEGTTKSNFIPNVNLKLELVEHFLAPLLGIIWPDDKDFPPGYENGHAEKPIVFHVGLGRFRDIPLVPSILPVQMIKIGPLVLAGHPGELTTVAGRLLREEVQKVFGPGEAGPVIAATYSNAFSSYTTTRWEYSAQYYEGASTLFGPWTLDAYLEEHRKLAVAIRDGLPVTSAIAPPIIPDGKILHHPGERMFPDGRIPGRSLRIGDVDGDAHPGYKRGDRVSVTFLGGYPGNNLRTNQTYLLVERLTAGDFVPLYDDHDLCTLFRWQAHGLASKIIIEWQIPIDEYPGKYRIKYFGDYWEALPKEPKGIVSTSREFQVS